MSIKKILLGIWAYLPVLALTDDLGFLTAIPNSKEHEYYISLINILFGEKKYQFISFPIRQSEKRMIMFRVKRLSEISGFTLSEEKENELEKNYKDHYDQLNAYECDIEKEALAQKLTEQQYRIDTSYNKINVFTTIILAIIPILITFVNKEKLISLNIQGLIIFVMLVYSMVNLCAWIFQAINVRGFKSSSFADLKNSMDKGKEQNWQMYYDWQQKRRKADMFVSFVIYIKQWITAVIILEILFSIYLPFSNIMPSKTYNNNSKLYTFQIENIEKVYDKSAIMWYNMLSELQESKYDRVLVLYSVPEIEGIKEKLGQFNKQEVNWIFDETLRENEIKIVLEK